MCVAAETGSRVGPFYRSSYSPQLSGQRDSCWHTSCTYETQRWGHTTADQGETVRSEMWPLCWSKHGCSFFYFLYLLSLCVGNGSGGELCSGSEWSHPCSKCGFQTSHHTKRPGHTAGRRMAQRWGMFFWISSREIIQLSWYTIMSCGRVPQVYSARTRNVIYVF